MTANSEQRILYTALFVVSILGLCIVYGFRTQTQADISIYRERGIVADAIVGGATSTYLPLAPSQHDVVVTFSIGSLLDGTNKIFRTTISRHVNPTYSKTLSQGDLIQVIYLEEDPEGSVILQDSLGNFQRRPLYLRYASELLFITLAGIMLYMRSRY
ncbi:MAG: hypothetical protein ACPG8W_17895 [Candidatus Promineifilaceae bacterium]